MLWPADCRKETAERDSYGLTETELTEVSNLWGDSLQVRIEFQLNIGQPPRQDHATVETIVVGCEQSVVRKIVATADRFASRSIQNFHSQAP